MRAGRFAIWGVIAALALVGVSGCADTTRSVQYNRDEPSERLAGMNAAAGTVVRVDEPQRVIVLDNGQMYRVVGDQAILVNGQPVMLSRVQPGTPVTIVSGTPVVYQNGQYVTVAPGTVVAPPAGTVVTAPPAGTVVAAPPGTVVTPQPVSTSAIRMYGRVTDIERNGNVKVRLSDGNAFEFRPPAGTVLRKGDPVTMDFMIGTAAPSALPR
jgi:hypothetical protein